MKSANDNQPTNELTFISMFSGIEAASVAFKPLGWKALAFAEIEKFPSAVLAHHYPEVPNVGDMSKHDWAQYRGKVDIVCGGPPCQAFSVAGLRNSLDDDRGNLSLVYMRALHAINPRNAIIENVPGWLSTKDNAFGCFLGGLVGADDAIPSPAGLKWPNSGMVTGPKGRAAWTILDAQYFGLAQRRKRVIVVADFGNGADPAAVLFIKFGLSRNPPARGKAGQDVAPTISARTKGGGGLGTDFDLDGGLRVETFDRQSNCEYGDADLASTDSARDYKSPTDLVAHCIAGNMINRADNAGPMGSGISADVSFTLTKNDKHAVCITGEITHALKAEGADASEDGTGRGNPIVAFGWQNSASQGLSDSEHISPTLDKSKTPAVMTVALRGREGGATAELGGEVATALRASGGGGDKAHVLTSAVRRLTPVECERLQGFWDGYTRIPLRKFANKKVTKSRPADRWEMIDGEWWLMAADGPRYKALGNSWAVPKFTWIGGRIARFMPDNDNAANNNEALNEAA